MHSDDSENSVSLRGKVTSADKVRYSASGIAILEFTVSVEQNFLGARGRGRYDILVMGDKAGALENKLRIGLPIQVIGKLWLREYKHKKGFPVKEIKIIAEKVNLESSSRPAPRKEQEL